MTTSVSLHILKSIINLMPILSGFKLIVLALKFLNLSMHFIVLKMKENIVIFCYKIVLGDMPQTHTPLGIHHLYAKLVIAAVNLFISSLYLPRACIGRSLEKAHAITSNTIIIRVRLHLALTLCILQTLDILVSATPLSFSALFLTDTRFLIHQSWEYTHFS